MKASKAGGKFNFKDYQLTDADCAALAPMAEKDAAGLYYNALVSFAQGCHSVAAGCVSWGCVELYYSVFYALRAELYYRGYLLIRDRGLYLVKIAKDEHPLTKSSKDYNTDHGGTINFFIDKYEASDYLCSNTVDTMNVYRWLMDLRETTNYRNKHFMEPDSFAELAALEATVKADGVGKALKGFKNDFGTYCFSNNHAWLCAPYYKLREVAGLYKAGAERLTAEQEAYFRGAMAALGMENAEIDEMI